MWGGRVPETTRDRADVTARLRPDKSAGAYSTRPGVVSPPWHPRYGASKDRQQSPRHAGPAARPNAHGGGLDYFRRAGQQLFDFHRDAITADDDHAARHRHVVGQNADLVLLGRVEFDNGAAAELQDLMDRHRGSAKHDGDVDRDIVEGRQRGLAVLM